MLLLLQGNIDLALDQERLVARHIAQVSGNSELLRRNDLAQQRRRAGTRGSWLPGSRPLSTRISSART
jgi:hypothetical protein